MEYSASPQFSYPVSRVEVGWLWRKAHNSQYSLVFFRSEEVLVKLWGGRDLIIPAPQRDEPKGEARLWAGSPWSEWGHFTVGVQLRSQKIWIFPPQWVHCGFAVIHAPFCCCSEFQNGIFFFSNKSCHGFVSPHEKLFWKSWLVLRDVLRSFDLNLWLESLGWGMGWGGGVIQ